jgi:hypothetical protein
MISNEIREKLQNIIRGARLQGTGDRCSTIRDLLIEGFGTGPTVKSEFESRTVVKEKQDGFLRSYARENCLWLGSLPADSEYLTKGGESKIYLAADRKNVIKVNDAVYYATWTEYFTSLLIHNLLFPNTPLAILGFMEDEGKLCLVLQQAFIEGGQALLEDIDELLTFNGFKNIKRQDYYNKEFGLLLEDMHDENVIAREKLLFFIDTVFYVIG